MTLDDLHKRATTLRAETIAFCDSVGFAQHSVDIMGSFEKVLATSAVAWARRGPWGKAGKSDRSHHTETMRKKTVAMANAIEIYLYAKEHGVEAAMIWKLSQ